MTLLRTSLSFGLIWGCCWATLAVVAGTIVGAIDPSQIDAGEKPLALAPMIGAVGFVCGILFSALLVIGGKTQSVGDVTLVRAVACGVLVSAALVAVSGKALPELIVIVPLGVLTALASTALIRSYKYAYSRTSR